MAVADPEKKMEGGFLKIKMKNALHLYDKNLPNEKYKQTSDSQHRNLTHMFQICMIPIEIVQTRTMSHMMKHCINRKLNY